MCIILKKIAESWKKYVKLGQISEDKAKKLLKIETDLSNNLIAEIEKEIKRNSKKLKNLLISIVHSMNKKSKTF